jgi:dienelactone hydrolase
MVTQDIEYAVGDKTFVGYLTRPESLTGKRPGVLVCHDAGGLREHAKDRARKLTELGYIAFAMDLYGEAIAGTEQAKAMIASLSGDLPTLRGRMNAALELLKSQPNVDASRTAAIGFCFGGQAVLELARSGAELACVVGFHSTLHSTAPEDAKNIKCKVMVCLGAKDPIVPAEQRAAFVDEMVKGGVDWQMLLYGQAVHAFTDKTADSYGVWALAYHELTDNRSWRAMLSLFGEMMESEDRL